MRERNSYTAYCLPIHYLSICLVNEKFEGQVLQYNIFVNMVGLVCFVYLVGLVCLVYLVGLVGFVYLVDLVCFVGLVCLVCLVYLVDFVYFVGLVWESARNVESETGEKSHIVGLVYLISWVYGVYGNFALLFGRYL